LSFFFSTIHRILKKKDKQWFRKQYTECKRKKTSNGSENNTQNTKEKRQAMIQKTIHRILKKKDKQWFTKQYTEY
jgi:ClpP class serine protease